MISLRRFANSVLRSSPANLHLEVAADEELTSHFECVYV